MKVRTLSVLIGFLLLCSSASSNPTGNRLPLFPPFNSSSSSVRRLHTSLSTLLPILPLLSPPPNHTLLVTLATSSFKHLLLNWICFLRHKARWDSADDLLKLLVVTSDKALAEELSDQGVVVWLLKGVNFTAVTEVDEIDEDLILQELKDDLFFNLRLLELLLPATPPSDTQLPLMHSWGTLHYQSLMLERTLVMSVLVTALADAQTVEVEDRVESEREWEERKMAHDWSTGPIFPEPFVGVKGVLLVDNDAVWLSSPSPHLSHPYRPGGPHPSIIYSPDSPPTMRNAWGGYSMPCACFFYSRTSDDLAHTSPSPNPTSYSPSKGAALGWQRTALCHISMLLRSLAEGKEQARYHETSESISNLVRAVAPSFQATALGPAIYLSQQNISLFPSGLNSQKWLDVLSSGDTDDIMRLLFDAGIDEEGETCVELASRNFDVSRNPNDRPLEVLSENSRSAPIKSEPLPYQLFPPGMSFFGDGNSRGGGGMEDGVRPCVVHANYASGSKKEELLRERGLWALSEGSCDAKVLKDA